MLKANGVAASVVEGGNSQFDVLDNGELVFSKQRSGRFPDEDEVLGLLSSPR